ncbi:E3 ubiquitin-protein ligase ATL6 [Spatholobus suberectus]|nr:E3 ubiquitin-protein ligase ATL6 [Spatholobus suberectus]
MLPKFEHVFHQHYINAWLPSRMTCPICRQNLTTSDDLLDVDIHTTNVPTEHQELGTESEVGITPPRESWRLGSMVGPEEDVSGGGQVHSQVGAVHLLECRFAPVLSLLLITINC